MNYEDTIIPYEDIRKKVPFSIDPRILLQERLRAQAFESFYKGQISLIVWSDNPCTEHVADGYCGGKGSNSRLHKECPKCWKDKIKEIGLISL